jgi:DNA polymerase-3 subunit delta
MLGERRVVVVLRGERLLKLKRKRAGAGAGAGASASASAGAGAGAGADEPVEADEGTADMDVLEEYIKKPVPETTLVIVAADVDRGRRLYKALQKHATIVECWGLRNVAQDPKNVKGWELERIAKDAAVLATRLLKEAGYTIDPAAARLLAVRAGADIVTLRGDLDRLMLYVGDRRAIDLRDVQDVVSGETLQDQWALADAIVQRDARRALRQLGLAFESGSVAYMILGQLGYCVREKVAAADARRVPAAVEALFRADLELKSSGGDPRVLLERLVVELCGR